MGLGSIRRTALVTGGTQGIGLAITHALAGQGATGGGTFARQLALNQSKDRSIQTR